MDYTLKIRALVHPVAFRTESIESEAKFTTVVFGK